MDDLEREELEALRRLESKLRSTASARLAAMLFGEELAAVDATRNRCRFCKGDRRDGHSHSFDLVERKR